MSLNVIQLNDTWSDRYGKFCHSCVLGHFYYSWKYRAFLSELLGCHPIYLGAIDSVGNLRGVLPLMEQSGPWGRVINSLPFFGSYGGILSDDERAKQALLDAYQDLVSDPNVGASTIISNPFDREEHVNTHNMKDSRISQITKLDFHGDFESALFSIIDPTARRNIRTAQRAQVSVAIENEAIQDLKDIHLENMSAIGGRSKPDAFFTLLPKYFDAGTDYRVYVARLDGKVVGSMLLFFSNNVVEYYMPGTRLAYRAMQPSALMIFQAMIDSAKDGCRLWNWGGTWLSQEGVMRFKNKWGAQTGIYHYYTNVKNTALTELSAAELLESYPYFYVLPFSKLKMGTIDS